IVAEKEATFGGTTAYSAGVIWIPGNTLAQRAGLSDSKESALAYMASEAGEFFDERKARAYVEQAPRMLDFMLERSH
ncbi:FAD-binding protein, partial [Paenibacillus polymyxa]|nr:FAD-binding protein [Paenibacillus polymyxa]